MVLRKNIVMIAQKVYQYTITFFTNVKVYPKQSGHDDGIQSVHRVASPSSIWVQDEKTVVMLKEFIAIFIFLTS